MNTLAAYFSAPRLRWAAEGLQAMFAQHGPVRTVAWARAAADAETCVAALAVLEQVPLALNLLADVERARLSGNPKKVERVIVASTACWRGWRRQVKTTREPEYDAALPRAVEQC